MGWLTGRIHHTAKEELHRLVEGLLHYPDGFDKPGIQSPYRLLDSAIVAMREAYMAVLDTRDGKIRAWVFLVSIRKTKGRSGLEFGYKDMDESMGPCATRCPARILARLSPVEECYAPGSNSLEWATKWRRQCNATVARGTDLKALKDGTRIKLDAPMKFMDGTCRDTFRVKFFGKKRRFVGEDGAVCRITNPKDLRFKILAA